VTPSCVRRFTFCATGEAVALTGATPVFVDVDASTYNMDAASLRRGITTAKQRGLKPRAVIPVDLFGQSADHDAIAEVAQAEGLFVLDDAAQGFGASYKGRRIGSLGLRPRPASSHQAARLLRRWRRHLYR
jgi:dTDP-4-amino-4,6-dideoxygalactose transaminase